MAIPLDIFDSEQIPVRQHGPSFGDEMRKRARNAIAKALRERPVVRKLLWITDRSLRKYYYSCMSRKPGATEYLVSIRNDRDGQWFIDCTCPAGNPFADENTGVIAWQPKPCYHAAAMLVYFTKTTNALEAKKAKRVKSETTK
jgi:hypothetical protein